ncbi:MAG: HIT family protein [Flavobacteriales bacterium CG18_big_fil_WC_8_21_14_2_50_32_9]|nr:HIT family protein [Flavobacteriales bacterium]PIQ16973.1 MAG: HIT family protein [Flavobacteriales bacterium CG18_big_fil_WC_8_21_14_2_50_32_9]PJC61732.1 MAG: HIT family protein [Flavobacteriales bacterium CG_4_9_14_0_2_um_filter_32_27]
MTSIFTKIINGEIPCYKVAENEFNIAFLDISPICYGHVLVVPKNQVDYIFDIEDNSYQQLWVFAKKVAKKIEKVVECKRIGVAVIGLEVPHTHIHLVPLNSIDDINFSKPKLSFPDKDLKELADKIMNAQI